MTRRTGRFRLFALLAVLVCALAAVLAGAAEAGAAPYTPSPSISLSQTNPCEQATVTVKGQDFTPGSTVTITVGTQQLGTAKVGADGTFTYSMMLPSGLSGKVTVTADGGSSANTATTEVDISAACTSGTSVTPGPPSSSSANSASGSGSSGSGSSGSSGLSNTGVAIFSMLVVALVLLVAGSILVVGGRRRRATA